MCGLCSYKLGEGERQVQQAVLGEGGMQNDILRMQNLILVLSQRVVSLEERFTEEFGQATPPVVPPAAEGSFSYSFLSSFLFSSSSSVP